jgi:hypothetical protein
MNGRGGELIAQKRFCGKEFHATHILQLRT